MHTNKQHKHHKQYKQRVSYEAIQATKETQGTQSNTSNIIKRHPHVCFCLMFKFILKLVSSGSMVMRAHPHKPAAIGALQQPHLPMLLNIELEHAT